MDREIGGSLDRFLPTPEIVAGPREIPPGTHYIAPLRKPLQPGEYGVTLAVSPKMAPHIYAGGGIVLNMEAIVSPRDPYIVCEIGRSEDWSTTRGITIPGGGKAIWATVHRPIDATEETIRLLGMEITSLAAEVLFVSIPDPEGAMRDLLTKRETDERRERRHNKLLCKNGDEVLAQIMDTAMTTEDIVMERETEKQIAEHTRRTLDQRQFVAWHMHVDDGLTQREIAEKMNRHESQVSRLLASGQAKLQKTTDPHGL